MNPYQSTFHSKARKITCVILLVILLVIHFASFKAHAGESASVHTYTDMKKYQADAQQFYLVHGNDKGFSLALWDQTWFRFSLPLLILCSLVYVQRVRVRKIQRMKSSFKNQLDEKNEEISHQAKNIKLQAELNHDLKENCDTLQSQLTTQTERANRAERAKNSFLSMISYGVRTPLNGLMGSSSLLMETGLDEEQKDLAKTINRCGENLLTAVNDMFDYAKIEAGEVKLEEKEFNLRRCIEEVLEVFSNKACESDVDFIYRIGKDVPSQIVGDSFRLKQVLINLVANAMKFTQQIEDILIEVRLGSVENNQCSLIFDVHNTGVGIHYDSAVSMFKSFSKADYTETTQYGGTGLGLSNCENLVRLMGGSISMESHRGKGSTFSFSINTRIAQNPFHVNEVFDTTLIQGKNVLVVDNHQNNLTVIKEQLEEWGMNVTLASTGFEAIRMLTDKKMFNLILVDLKIPGLDGIQITQEIKKLHPSASVAIMSPLENDHWKKESGLFSASIVKPLKQLSLYKGILSGLKISESSVKTENTEANDVSADFSYQYPVRILIAEDNLINQRLTQRVLGKLGYKSTVVMNGREALDIIDKNDYDMIFMDVQMPVLNGLEATIQIRQQDRIQPVIVAMTANTMTGDRKDCIRAGMDDYISKPMNQNEMINIIKKWALQIKASRQQRFLAQA